MFVCLQVFIVGVVTCVKRLVSFRGVAAAGNTGEGGEAPGKSDAVFVCLQVLIMDVCTGLAAARNPGIPSGSLGGIMYWGGV